MVEAQEQKNKKKKRNFFSKGFREPPSNRSPSKKSENSISLGAPELVAQFYYFFSPPFTPFPHHLLPYGACLADGVIWGYRPSPWLPSAHPHPSRPEKKKKKENYITVEFFTSFRKGPEE
ncbi:hypothetical protein CDAR_184961 [Caerostris darwini]|uniref:Uncharacterized protein n=1 Tax=Caerostris darwini TaxID=1538125 RepID=A0AAV4SQT8_9ARAC|nr:hypothetical protein CDAR_184961 [Caerostris darwini]